MANVEVVLSLAGAGLGFLVTAVTFIAKFLKSTKSKKIAEQVVQIGNAVLPYIVQAESFASYSGQEKKEFVLTKANQFAIEKGISFNTEIMSEKVEELVALTKSVNQRDKDKICSAISANASEYAKCMQCQESE